jgi:hypothetical protein
MVFQVFQAAHVSSTFTIVSDSRLGFLASLLHPSDLDPCLHLRTILQLTTMHPLCISSRRSNALFSTAVLVLVVWVAVHQWKIVNNQRVRLGHTISRLHFPCPSSGSINGQSCLSTLPPPSDSSTLVSENLSASNSTLGASRNALLPLRPTTDLPFDSSPKSSP